MNVGSYRQRTAANREKQRPVSDSRCHSKEKSSPHRQPNRRDSTALVAKLQSRHLPNTQRSAILAVAGRTSELSCYSGSAARDQSGGFAGHWGGAIVSAAKGRSYATVNRNEDGL